MTVGKLKAVLAGIPNDTPVHVIMDGTIDEAPDYNVAPDIQDNGILYIEGVGPSKERQCCSQ